MKAQHSTPFRIVVVSVASPAAAVRVQQAYDLILRVAAAAGAQHQDRVPAGPPAGTDQPVDGVGTGAATP